MVVALKKPSLIPEELAQLSSDMVYYMEHINELHGVGADWLFYDEGFRLFKQYNPVRFRCVDHELRAKAISAKTLVPKY